MSKFKLNRRLVISELLKERDKFRFNLKKEYNKRFIEKKFKKRK